jgi:pyruvate formate lyase activating enzyme
VVAAAIRNDCRSISYTYTEPTIYLEYALDTAVLAKEQGLFNVMVTNGYTTTSVIEHNLKGAIHAANIDLKAFTERFYKKLCSARLAAVLDAIKAYHDAGIWIEITTLIIPFENDSDEELHDIASFINSISPSIPWHISRYHPSYKYDLAPPTPVSTIERAREIGLSEGLHFVYSGNVRGHVGENTYCPNCEKLIIARKGFFIERLDMKGQACGYCNHTIPGRFN